MAKAQRKVAKIWVVVAAAVAMTIVGNAPGSRIAAISGSTLWMKQFAMRADKLGDKATSPDPPRPSPTTGSANLKPKVGAKAKARNPKNPDGATQEAQ